MDKCPAKAATCHWCQRIGHFSNQCFSSIVSCDLQDGQPSVPEEDYLDSAYLNTTLTSQVPLTWTTTISVDGLSTTFKIDTGAEVTAISERTFEKLPCRPQLNTPSKTLRGPSSHVLDVAGQFQSKLKHNNNESIQEIYVVKGLKNNLLGLPAITALQLVSRIEPVTSEDRKEEIKRLFPNLFQRLSNFGDEYETKCQTFCFEETYHYHYVKWSKTSWTEWSTWG